MFYQNKSIVRKEYEAPQFRPLNLITSAVLCLSGDNQINGWEDDDDSLTF